MQLTARPGYSDRPLISFFIHILDITERHYQSPWFAKSRTRRISNLAIMLSRSDTRIGWSDWAAFTLAWTLATGVLRIKTGCKYVQANE